MKKFTSQKEISKIAKATLAMVLAGSFTFSTTKAFAEEGTATTSDQSQTVKNDTSATATTSEKQDAPSLMPGDFFYFAKIALEKIQLALTFDDTKEAKLLADNASERLAEAEALFAAGKQKEAVDTIKEALKAMADSDKLVGDQQDKSDETTTTDDQKTADETTATTTDDEKASDETTVTTTDDQKAADGTTATTTDDQKAADGTTATTTDDQTTTTTTNDKTATSDQTTKTDDSQATEDDGLKEVKDVLSQNIIALKAALEHVKNPVARAALQKNIDKSYAKLAKKLDKWEEHLAKKHEEKKQNNVEQDDVTKDETTENTQDVATTPVSQENADVKATTPVTNTDVTTEQKTDSKVPAKEEQQPKNKVQTVQKAAHQEIKQVQQEVKQNRQEVKNFAQKKKEELRHKVQVTEKGKLEQRNHGDHGDQGDHKEIQGHKHE